MKKIFTKRRVLILVNAIFFIFVVVCCALTIDTQLGWGVGAYDKERFILVFSFIGSQCTFTGLSLIVYYLAIMAGALNKKYKDEAEDKE